MEKENEVTLLDCVTILRIAFITAAHGLQSSSDREYLTLLDCEKFSKEAFIVSIFDHFVIFILF